MINLKKVTAIVGFLIIVSLVIWVIVLSVRISDMDDGNVNEWREKYENAEDSIAIIKKDRDSLRVERIYLDSMRVYWKKQYKYKDSLLSGVKTQYNEDMANIRDADATERNRMLSNRLRQIHNRRR